MERRFTPRHDPAFGPCAAFAPNVGVAQLRFVAR